MPRKLECGKPFHSGVSPSYPGTHLAIHVALLCPVIVHTCWSPSRSLWVWQKPGHCGSVKTEHL